MRRDFIVTRTELQLHNGMVEVSASSPEYVMNPAVRESGRQSESLFLYLDPKNEPIPMVGEIIKAQIATEVDDG
jgi:hypothetical protein